LTVSSAAAHSLGSLGELPEYRALSPRAVDAGYAGRSGDLTVTGQAVATIFRHAAERGLAEGAAQLAHAADRLNVRGTLRE